MLYISRWTTARKKEHKNPPNLKTNSEGNLGYNKITHPNIVFFIWWVCSFKYETKRADDSWIVPQFHRLCVLSVWLFDDSYLQVVNFNQSFLSAFWTIKGIILQNFFKTVSFLILLRVLLPQTGHNIYSHFIIISF